MHGHRDMEIVTYVLAGALDHRDSLGNGEVLRPGELQRMTAGTGIRHSEFNPSATEPVHLYQIWLLPERAGPDAQLRAKGVRPAGRQRPTAPRRLARRRRRLAGTSTRTPASIWPNWPPAARSSARSIPAAMAGCKCSAGESRLAGQNLSAGDGAAVSEESQLAVTADDARS